MATLQDLKKDIITVGKGTRKPQTGNTCVVHYTGWLVSNGKKFDSSKDRNQPFEFTIGKGQVIEGWDKGVATMVEGEVATFIIPASMGYGKRGVPQVIPANADLKFDVELIAIR